MTGTGLKLGALGGPETFSAQFAKVILARYPEFAAIAYFPTTEAGLEAAERGEVDATCVPEQMSTTGFHAGTHSRMLKPASKLHVVAEISHPYHCCLLGKPGASLAQLRRVLGHTGSSAQSRPWIEANLPEARVEIVDTHSLDAARTVLEGDGSIASVGTAELARAFGLAELARDIDGGCIGNYWAVSREPRFSDTPTRVVAAGRFGDDGQLSALIRALAEAGFALQTIHSRGTGTALYEYGYLLRFRGTGTLAAVRAALVPWESVRLAGAFEAR